MEADGLLLSRVGDPGREVEYLVLDADAHPRRIDRAAGEALRHRDPWVSVPTGDPGRTSDRLAEHGLVSALVPEWLMTVPLAAQRRTPLAEGYRCEPGAEPGGTVVHLRVLAPDGTLAASGRLGLVDGWAVPDKIATVARHRRRGLGAAVMTVLVDAALDRGASHGVLVASDQGRRLYQRLGWELGGAVVLGRTR